MLNNNKLDLHTLPTDPFEPAGYTIFISAALFTYAEQVFNRHLRDALAADGFRVILPQEFEMQVHEKELFDQCVNGIERADLVLAVVDGAEVDVGVGFEMGLAYSKGKPVLALRTDFRRRAETTAGCLNLMLHYGATRMINAGDNPFQEATLSVRQMLQDVKNHPKS